MGRTRNARSAIGAIAVAASLALSAVPAHAATVDRRSARTFITGAATYMRALLAAAPAAQAGARGFLSHIEQTCSGSLRIDLQAPAAVQSTIDGLYVEAVFELSLSEVRADEPAALRFFGAVARLHWTDARVASAIATDAAAVHAAAGVAAAPDLCTDIGTAQAAGFASLPTDTVGFLLAGSAVSRPGGKTRPSMSAVVKLLRRYVTSSDAAAYKQLQLTVAHYDEVLGQITGSAVDTLELVLGAGTVP